MTITVKHIYRYPIKGLSPESLDTVDLAAGTGIPGDRRFAMALPSTHFDPAVPEWLPKSRFLMLMRHERLAALETRFDEVSEILTIRRDGADVMRERIGTDAGRAAIECFFSAFMEGKIEGKPHLVAAPGRHMFSDHKHKVLSVINLATIRDLERVVGKPVDPIRFRANLYIAGAAPWVEFQWIGKTLEIGGARLTATERIDRCAATAVNPGSGVRDINIPRVLQKSFGHIDCGVYARVTASGCIAGGDAVRIGETAEPAEAAKP